LASDFDNQDPAAIAAPTPEESETKTDGKGADPKSAGAKSGDAKPSADTGDSKAPEPNGKAEPPAGQPGGRKRQGGAAPQANPKNGTLDLVELKDMSIQKSRAPRDCASKS
jgi:hypothetical protein